MGLCSELENTPEMQKCPKSLLKILGCGQVLFSSHLRVSYKLRYGSKATSREYEPSWHLHT